MGTSEYGAGTVGTGQGIKCPQCGAHNRAGAEWCGQCLERFPPPGDEAGAARPWDPVVGHSPPPPPPSPNGADGPPSQRPGIVAVEPNGEAAVDRGEGKAATIEGENGAIEIKGRDITWTCSRCDTTNGWERNLCEVCGASFAEVIREPDEASPKRDPNTVALVSLFLPGAGHAYLGMWGQAIARGVISTWIVATAIFAAAQGAAQSMIVAMVFGFMSFMMWAVSAHDAYREAQGQRAAVLLKDKLFLYLVLGLLLLSVMMVFSMALGARGA